MLVRVLVEKLCSETESCHALFATKSLRCSFVISAAISCSAWIEFANSSKVISLTFEFSYGLVSALAFSTNECLGLSFFGAFSEDWIFWGASLGWVELVDGASERLS